MAQPASRDRLSSTTLSLSLVALSCAFSSELHNETAAVATTASLERDGGGGGWQDANPDLLVYMKAAKVLDSLQPAQPALCTGLAKLAEMADTGSYAVRNWGLAALREAQQQDCVPLEGRVLTGETSDVNSAPWGSGGPKLRLGAFGPGDEETAEALEQIDREEEWNEARQKHALRDIKRVDEAFAFEVDVADIHPEDDALARWALGKRYEDAMPDSRLRVAMQRILGAAEADAVGGSRSHAHDVEYGPPMDRSELIAKHANLARVVLLARDDVWESLPLSEGLLLPSSAPSADAARTLVRVALQHFKKLKLDVLTEEGQLWWARWAACFERNGDELTDAGDTPRRFDEMRELAIGKIWLERMLDALGSRLRGEECCNWLKAAKPLLQAAWGTDETARWLTRVEERSEHEATDDGYREKKHERALLVERYRTMMRQLRDNRRFLEEERAKLVRLGYLIDTEGVGTANHAGLTFGATQQDLDERWHKELVKLHGVQQRYTQFAPGDSEAANPCAGPQSATGACLTRFRPWVERGYGHPKEWIQGSEREMEVDYLAKPIASSGGYAAPPRFSRAAGQGTERFGAFPPTESHPEYGPNYDPEDYYRPYYTSGRGDPAHDYVPHRANDGAVLY